VKEKIHKVFFRPKLYIDLQYQRDINVIFHIIFLLIYYSIFFQFFNSFSHSFKDNFLKQLIIYFSHTKLIAFFLSSSLMAIAHTI